MSGPVEVSTAKPGTDATTLLSVANAQAAVESTLAAVSACFASVTDPVDASYKVQLDVDAAGKVAALRSVETTLPASVQSCVDDALRAATVPALAQADATVTIAAALSAKVTPEAPAPVAAEPAPAAQTAAPAPATEQPATPGDAKTTAPAPTAPATDANASSNANASGDAAGAVTASADAAAPTKPWKVGVSLSTSLGQGTFIKDEYAAAPLYSYAVSMSGSYKVHPMLSLGVRMDFDQELTTSNRSGTSAGVPREFFFRDIRLTASSSELYKEPNTGIKLGASLAFYLPVSKLSRRQDWVTSDRVSATLTKVFENVGPGELTLGYNFGWRHYFGPEASTVETDTSLSRLCRTTNRNSAGECWSSWANPRDSIINGFNVNYDFLEKFSFSVDLQIINTFAAQLGDNPRNETLASGTPASEVGSSPNALRDSNQSDLTTGTIELAYQITKELSAAAGLSTTQPVYIQDGSNSKKLRFPFWDFSSTADNLSAFYLQLAFSY